MESQTAIISSNDYFKNISSITIDEDVVTDYATSIKIETLIQELWEKGPLVAVGGIGPKYYTEKPFQLTDKFQEVTIWGWKPGTRSPVSMESNTYAIIVGARKIENVGYVYFKLSYDAETDNETYIREHRELDSKIYVVSHKTFSMYLYDIYPPASEEKKHPNFVSSGSLSCSPQELPYVVKLVSITPLDSILGDNKTMCKQIGQKIFDTFKKDNNGDSMAGKSAVQGICEAMKVCAKDGSLRKEYIDRAWNNIGDNKWRWIA